jgi:hypothetical protein
MPIEPRIEQRDDGVNGIRVFDPIDRQEYYFETPESVVPRPAATNEFIAPLDTAARIRTSELVLPDFTTVYVRDSEGAIVQEVQHLSSVALEDDGWYTLELTTPIKLYLRVRGPLTITNSAYTEVSCEQTRTVFIGARSFHEQPAGTIETPADPTSVMEAISYFGSALKTASCERSYPTLRGHPPLIEVGDDCDEVTVPDGLAKPDVGVSIHVSPTWESVFAIAPLAYYLGAQVNPTTGPAELRTTAGVREPLDTPTLHSAVNRVLRHVLTLDCCTRCDGIYNVALAERETILERTKIDFSTLYDQPLAEQLGSYLDIPWETVSEIVPTWELAATITDDIQNVQMLPFLADSLALLSAPESERTVREPVDANPEVEANIESFLRVTTSATRGDDGWAVNREVQHRPTPTTDALAQTWVGPRTTAPPEWNWTLSAAHHNRLSRAQTEGNLEIAVVLNDIKMQQEKDLVDDTYRGNSPFDVTIYDHPSTDELATALEADLDFLHYIGHIHRDGMECIDGLLDVHDLDTVGVDAFFLNACASREQGLALLERGSIAGVVTSTAIGNSGATELGVTFARLLDAGFTVYSALDIARNQSEQGLRYSVIGDGRLAVSQSDSGVQNLIKLHANENAEDEYTLFLDSHPSTGNRVGTCILPHIAGNNQYYLCYGAVGEFYVSTEELRQFLSMGRSPVQYEDERYWSDEIDL